MLEFIQTSLIGIAITYLLCALVIELFSRFRKYKYISIKEAYNYLIRHPIPTHKRYTHDGIVCSKKGLTIVEPTLYTLLKLIEDEKMQLYSIRDEYILGGYLDKLDKRCLDTDFLYYSDKNKPYDDLFSLFLLKKDFLKLTNKIRSDFAKKYS